MTLEAITINNGAEVNSTGNQRKSFSVGPTQIVHFSLLLNYFWRGGQGLLHESRLGAIMKLQRKFF